MESKTISEWSDEATRVYNSAEDWWQEEYWTYGVMDSFYEEVIAALNNLPCCGKGNLPRKVRLERYARLWEESPFTKSDGITKVP